MGKILGKKGLLGKISERFSKKRESEDEDFVTPAYSLMTPEMITPLDKPISVSRAVQIYKKYMLGVGYLEKDDISDYVRSLKEDMAELEEEMKFDLKSAKEQLAEAKAEVKACRKKLAKSKDNDDREYASEELDEATKELEEETAVYEKLSDSLTCFKKDKREFLLDYINSEIHGDNWREE